MNRKRHALIFFPVFIVLFISFSCTKEEKKVSTGKPMPDSGFRAELRVKDIPSEIKKGEETSAIVTVKNISDQTWPSKGDSKDHYRINLSYQFFNEAGEPLVMDVVRTPLPRDLKPGESLDLTAVVKAPEKPGKYEIRFDLVQEAVAWFGHKNKDNYSKPSAILVTP
jgi:hypothetical protein